jgi:cytochrome c biogenesis protein CcmG, thiol:disulfide interchange protein DsbE
MNRFVLPLAAFALLLLVLIAGLRHAPEKGIIVSPLLGKQAPQFSLPGLLDDTSPLQAQTLRGHWSLVNVWGTWCQECRAEHETLLQIKRQGKVPIFGIDWKDDDTQARAWLSELGNPYERVGADREGRVAIDWGVYGAPESFLINPAGTVVYKHVGALTPQIWQQEFLSRLL